jgi:hypothetical protein
MIETNTEVRDYSALDRNVRQTCRLAPLYVLVPVAFLLAFWAAGVKPSWVAYALGAAGWLVAGALRPLVAAMVKGLGEERAYWVVGLASGPCEETVRLGALAIIGTSYAEVISLGQGWAAVEVLFLIANVVVLAGILNRSDEKANKLREALMSQQTSAPQASPFVGVMERIFASCLHIGFTLLLARSPWMLALTLPAHSLVNMAAVVAAKRSVALAETITGLSGAAALIAGLLVTL